MESQIQITNQSVVQCFQYLHDLNSTPQVRKLANTYLLQMQQNYMQLLPVLLQIFQNNIKINIPIALQALIYFSNIIKRHWNLRRHKTQNTKNFEGIKQAIKDKLIQYLISSPSHCARTLYDIISFICQADYPQNFNKFTLFIIKCCENLQINRVSITTFKQIKEIFIKISERKSFHVINKIYQQQLRPIVKAMGFLSEKLRGQICQEKIVPDIQKVKISKYCDQIIVAILVLAPQDKLDEQIVGTIKFCIAKLQSLLTIHQQNSINQKHKELLQKNIKSLIFSLSYYQYTYPLAMASIISQYFQILAYVIFHYDSFIKSAIIRYTLLALRKFIKQFSYYSDENSFLTATGNKRKTPYFLQLRQICNTAYYNHLNPQNKIIENLMNVIIGQLIGFKYKDKLQNQFFVDFDDSVNIDRDRNAIKQFNVQICALGLIEVLLERFPQYAFSLVKMLLDHCFQSKWQNIPEEIQSNIFSVISILPRTIRNMQFLQQIPILDILAYIHNSNSYKIKQKFPILVSGWIDIFNNDQTNALLIVLLEVIQKEKKIELLLHACQALNKMIQRKLGTINIQPLVGKIFPIAVNVFRQTDNSEILWPMINLISSIVVKTQFDSNIILNSIQDQTFTTLLTSQSSTLIEAICQMFQSFLCIIPRNSYAKSLFRMTYFFLNTHLNDSSNSAFYEKLIHLWYIAVREYSQIQQCNNEYIELFTNYYKRILLTYNKSNTSIYILEQYMLLELIDGQLQQYMKIIQKCYQEAQQLQKNESNQIKIAALSFYITLITKYGLQKVNTQNMLILIIKNFCTIEQDKKKVSGTLRNSLLSIINRYIIFYRNEFFAFLNSLNLPVIEFVQMYFLNMAFLTSRTAVTINIVALSSLLNYLDPDIIINKMQQIMRIVIPELQIFMNNQKGNTYISPVGKVQNSPRLRFGNNFLSQKKQQIRKKSGFDSINIHELFKKEIYAFLNKINANIEQILLAFNGDQYFQIRMKTLLG